MVYAPLKTIGSVCSSYKQNVVVTCNQILYLAHILCTLAAAITGIIVLQRTYFDINFGQLQQNKGDTMEKLNPRRNAAGASSLLYIKAQFTTNRFVKRMCFFGLEKLPTSLGPQPMIEI